MSDLDRDREFDRDFDIDTDEHRRDGASANAAPPAPVTDRQLRGRLRALAREPHMPIAPYRWLRESHRTTPDLAQRLAHLAARDPDPALADAAGRALRGLWESGRYGWHYQGEGPLHRGKRAAVAMLADAIRDPAVAEARRLALCSLLRAAGTDDDADALAARLAVPAAPASRPRYDLVTEAAEELERHLGDHGVALEVPGQPRPAWRARVRAAHAAAASRADLDPAAGAALLAANIVLGRQRRVPLGESLAAVARLAQVEHPRAAWYLRALAALPALGRSVTRAVTQAAAQHRHRHRPEPPPVGALVGVRLGRPADGECALLVEHRTGERREVLTVVLGSTGVTRAWVGWESPVHCWHCRRQPPRDSIAISMAEARALVARALARNRAHRRVPDPRWLLHRHRLGPAPIPIARTEDPDLSAYAALADIGDDTALVTDSARLFLHAAFRDAWDGPESRSAWYRRVPWSPEPESDATAGAGPAPRQWFHRGLAPAAFDAELRATVAPARAAIVFGLALGLEYEALAGRAGTPAARQAWHVWRAIRQASVPLGRISYGVLLAWRNLLQRQAREQRGEYPDLAWWHLARCAGRRDCRGHAGPRWVHRALAASVDGTDAEVRLGWWTEPRDAYVTGRGWTHRPRPRAHETCAGEDPRRTK